MFTLNENLRQHKAHLEELTGERSEPMRDDNSLLSEETQKHAIGRNEVEQASEAKTTLSETAGFS